MTTLVDATPLPAADLSIRDLWPIYLRRRKVFYAALGVVLLLAVVYCCIATRRYSATGTIEVQNESMGGMELSDVFNGQEVTTDAMTTGLDLETQADILKSDTLALQVIRELNLEDSPDFRRVGYVSQVLSLVTFWHHQPVLSESARRARSLHIFGQNLKVKTESGTRLIDISYRSMDPVLAGQVVNHLIQALVGFNLERAPRRGWRRRSGCRDSWGICADRARVFRPK